MRSKVVVCIYTCARDIARHKRILNEVSLLKDLEREGIVYNYIFADPNISDNFILDKTNHLLTVKREESYSRLSEKTQGMLAACSELYDFDYLIKIDGDLGIEDCNSIDHKYQQINNMIFQSIHADYIGSRKMRLRKDSFRAWCKSQRSKGIEYPGNKVYTTLWRDILSNLNYFYHGGSGYTLSKDFCDFILTKICSESISRKFSRFLGGSEDVMIRYYYHLYTIDKEQYL